MGGLLSRTINTGYYDDMLDGYLSQAGGSPFMIRFPEELQSLPERCPHCDSSSGLVMAEMEHRLRLERQRFRKEMDAIIKKRVADGERHPYPRYYEVDGKEEKVKIKQKSSSLLRFFKRNTIAPGRKLYEKDGPFYFPVHTAGLIVCECMLRKCVEFVFPEEDDHSGYSDVETLVFRKQKHLEESQSEEETGGNEATRLLKKEL